MNLLRLGLVGLALAATSALAGTVAPSHPAASKETTLGRIELGTRLIHVQLQEDKRGGKIVTTDALGRPVEGYKGTFLGSLSILEEEQDYAPTRIYAQYFFNDYIGLGASYDKVEADARDEEGSDGIVGVEGPILYAIARCPNIYPLVPFVEAGVALYHSYFDEDATWRQHGSAFERRMENEDTTAFVLGLGVDYQITEDLSVNLYGRMVEGATVDAEAWYKKDDNAFRTGEFPLDYYGLGLGLKYTFQ